MTGLLIGLALIIALAVTGWRATRRLRLRARLQALPGGSAETAMVVSSFADIEEEIRRRRCHCGGRYDAYGEGSREAAGKRLRAVHVVGRFCEKQSSIHFDVSRLFH